MAKRFTDSDKWEDPWFVDLSPNSKVLFLFLCDNCDMAGFYERHDRMTSFYTQIPPDQIVSAYSEINKSVICRDRWVFVKNFVRHQKNLPLNPLNGAHLSIIRSLILKGCEFSDLYSELFGFSLEELRGLEGATKPLTRGLGIDIGKGKGKGKGKEEGIAKGRFKKPSFEEVTAYFTGKGHPAEAQAFWNYYETCGWVVGKARKPMVSWHGAVATWLDNLAKWDDRPAARPSKQKERREKLMREMQEINYEN
jgi:hypothetical protein